MTITQDIKTEMGTTVTGAINTYYQAKDAAEKTAIQEASRQPYFEDMGPEDRQRLINVIKGKKLEEVEASSRTRAEEALSDYGRTGRW
jgi:hypothetical protein